MRGRRTGFVYLAGRVSADGNSEAFPQTHSEVLSHRKTTVNQLCMSLKFVDKNKLA